MKDVECKNERNQKDKEEKQRKKNKIKNGITHYVKKMEKENYESIERQKNEKN